MVKRKQIVVGDPPVTGGAVLPNGVTSTLGDGMFPVALIGGQVKCEACGKIGIITKSGGPRRCRIGGEKEQALEGDLCLCACHPPPPILSVMPHTSSYDDMGSGSPAPFLDRKYNQHFQIVDEATGKPLKNRPYKIIFDGETIEGTTDDEGKTKIVYHDSAKNIEIHY